MYESNSAIIMLIVSIMWILIATKFDKDEMQYRELLISEVMGVRKTNKSDDIKICPVCGEFTNAKDLVPARYDIYAEICPDCREDGN